ncbi:MAG TPA: M17 family peptidase N-terminal domain-containing protein, partial [Acidobacteriota bacterium]|nr:M17 family peptidase N-terminal domain-containing protein [Acidobacteriota bacterium]
MSNLKLITRDPWEISSDGVAILVMPDHVLTATGSSANEKLRGSLKAALRTEAFRVRKGNIVTYYPKDKNGRKILFAAFTQKEERTTELRDIAYACAAAASQRGMQKLILAFDPQNEEEVQAIGEGALLATYRYEQFRSKTEIKPPVGFIGICGNKNWNEGVRRADIFARATMMVRDLVNEPANKLNALKLAQVAQDVAKRAGLQIKLFTPAQMERLGARAFLSVGKGSKVPNRMIHVSYRPKAKARAHVALVGKGITFDSGGLSLKLEKAMEHMKSDMAGGATVLACVRAAKELRLPMAVTAILMVTENMPGEAANRPGDIVRAMNGKTIEITNT